MRLRKLAPQGAATPSRLLAGGALILLGLAAGCGGSGGSGDDPAPPAAGDGTASPGPAGDPPAAGDIPDACSLLLLDEVESVTGTGYLAGQLEELASSESQSVCRFPAETGSGFVVVVVNGTGEQFELQRESAAANLTVEDVAGVGDEAYWTDETDTVATHVGPLFVQVTVAGADQATVADLIRTALGRL
jgi:hypothetical protein